MIRHPNTGIIAGPRLFAAGLPLATHWRIVSLGISRPTFIYPGSLTLSVGNIEMAAYPGGPNLCSGGTPTNYVGSYGTVANLFDGNNATYSENNTPPGANSPIESAVGYVFPAPVSVNAVRLRAPPVAGGPAKMWLGFVVQYSLDGGTTWVSSEPIGPVTTQWVAEEEREFVLTPLVEKTVATAKLWRMANIVISGGNTYTGEIQYRATSGGASLSTGNVGVAFGHASSAQSPYSSMFDGNNNSWINHDDGEVIGFFFDTAPNPSHIWIKRWFGAQINSFDAQWSSDGTVWNLKTAVVGIAATDPIELAI